MLEEESVELGHLPKDDKLTNGEESHVRTFRVHPTHCRPTLRSKLECSSLNLAGCGRNVANSHPFVLTHFHDLAQFQAHPNAEAIAYENVENDRVPPALNEVR